MKKIFEHQKYLMDEVYKLKSDPKSMVEHYRITSLAAVDELMEALHHVPWKPWSKRIAWDWSELREELVDVFTFLIQLCLLAGLDSKSLEKGYFEKAKINLERQDSGTYGVDSPQPMLSQRQLDELYEIAELGECTTARVGCLIVTRDGREAWGYNCAADGVPCTHEASDGCPGRTVHAEVAALAAAAQQGFQVSDATAYVTHEPCDRCMAALTMAGVERVRVIQR